MFYFGFRWLEGTTAFDTFACSRDLVNWTRWDGPPLLKPSEPFDRTFAHKPWLLKHDGVVYHFYCAVGTEGRVIALATSKDLKSRTAVAMPARQLAESPGRASVRTDVAQPSFPGAPVSAAGMNVPTFSQP
jgi:hypothetical protein